MIPVSLIPVSLIPVNCSQFRHGRRPETPNWVSVKPAPGNKDPKLRPPVDETGRSGAPASDGARRYVTQIVLADTLDDRFIQLGNADRLMIA